MVDFSAVAGIVVLGFVLGVFIWGELKSSSTIIESVSVPQELETSGLSGLTVAQWLAGNLRTIYENGKIAPLPDKERAQSVVPKADLLDAQLPGGEFSVQSLVAVIRDALGRPRSRVTAAIGMTYGCESHDNSGRYFWDAASDLSRKQTVVRLFNESDGVS